MSETAYRKRKNDRKRLAEAKIGSVIRVNEKPDQGNSAIEVEIPDYDESALEVVIPDSVLQLTMWQRIKEWVKKIIIRK